MKLFESVEELKDSGYIFRITDNGGKTFDRFTIIFCDGDYFGSSCNPCHPQGFGQSGEDIDLQGLENRIEGGEERDLRWIDLPEAVRDCVLGMLNQAFADYLETNGEGLPARREDVEFGRLNNWSQYGLYKTPEGFKVAIEGEDPESDFGPFATFKEVVIASLPQDYDLSGPEYHTPVDLWSEEGGPAPLWDCEAEPPHPYEVLLFPINDGDSTNPFRVELGEVRDEEHAREVIAEWRAANPELSPLYRATFGGKADRTFHTLEGV